MKRYVISSMVSLAAISGAAQTWTYSDCVEYAREHNISLQKSRLTELSSEYTLEELSLIHI